MKHRTWTLAALAAITVTTTASSAFGQSLAITAVHTAATLSQDIDPDRSDKDWTEVKENGGRRIRKTRVWRDKNGKTVAIEEEVQEYDSKGTQTGFKRTRKEYGGDGKVKKTEETDTKYGEDGTTTTESEDGKKKRETKRVAPMGPTEETEFDKDGKPTKKTKTEADGSSTETEFEKGKPKKTVTHDKNGKKASETEHEKDGSSKKTEYDKDGKPTSETDYDKKGNPIRKIDLGPDGKVKGITTYHPDGTKKTEADAEDGKTTKRREYDKKGRLVKETDADGNTEETEYDDKGNVKKKTYTGSDGKTVVPYKNGEPQEPKHWDKDGKPVSRPPSPAIQHQIFAPHHISAGESFSATVVDLKGEVVANQPVTLDGGPDGRIMTSTDLNGIVVAKAPDHWKTVRILSGAAMAALLIDKFDAPSGKPRITQPPSFIQPGTNITIPGEGFAGTLNGNSVKIGPVMGKIVGASPRELIVSVPNTVPLGGNEVTVSNAAGSAETFRVQAVTITWAPGASQLVVGQRTRRTLIVNGTQESVAVKIIDLSNDSVDVFTKGLIQSSGGAQNTVPIELNALRIGSYSVKALLANIETDYENDLDNSEASKRDAAGWQDSADAESNPDLKSQMLRAAKNALLAADDWKAAADARMRGDDKKAEKLENAARERDLAAREFGSNGNHSAGKAAEAAARMWEREAGR